jgi:predicted Zn-dependent protease
MRIDFCIRKQIGKLLLAGVLTLGISSVTFAQDAPAAATEKSAIALYNEGVNALKAQDFKTGFTTLETAFKKAMSENNTEVLGLAKKNAVSAAFNYGNELVKNKMAKDAIGIYERGMAIDSAFSLFNQGIGRAKEETGDIDGAAKSYFAFFDAAKAENDTKKMDDAKGRFRNMLLKQLNAKAYARVIKIGSEYMAKDKNSEITYLVGKAYADKGDPTNGIKYLLESVAQATEGGGKADDKVNYALGLAYEAKKDNKNAIKYYSIITDAKYKAAAQSSITRLNAAK